MSDFKYCMVQLLDWERQQGQKKQKLLKCKDCYAYKDCNNREKDLLDFDIEVDENDDFDIQDCEDYEK